MAWFRIVIETGPFFAITLIYTPFITLKQAFVTFRKE